MGDQFFDEIVENFFEEIGSNFRSTFCRGQIFWTHAFFAEENIAFWRPRNYDETQTHASEFVITTSTKDAFKRRIPLYSPKLEIDEEFIVVTAKKRPVILISPVPARIEAPKIRRGGKINLNLCLVAPLYSVEDIEGRAKYGNEFVDRVRKLEFPHLFFVPENKLKGIRNNICRLDRLQHSFYNQMEAINVKIAEEAFNVFKGQIEYFITERYGDDYQVYRELLLEES